MKNELKYIFVIVGLMFLTAWIYFNGKLNEAKSTIDRLKEERLQKLEIIENLKSQIEENEIERIELINQLNEIQSDFEEAQFEFEKVNSELESTKLKLDKANNAWQTFKVKSESDELKLNKLIEESNTLRSEIEGLEDERDQIVQERDLLRQENASLKVIQAEYERNQRREEEYLKLRQREQQFLEEAIENYDVFDAMKITNYELKSTDDSNVFQLLLPTRNGRKIVVDNLKVKSREILNQTLSMSVTFNYVWLKKDSEGKSIEIIMKKNGRAVYKSGKFYVSPEGDLSREFLIYYFKNLKRNEVEGDYSVSVNSKGISILKKDFEFTVE